MFHFLLVGCVFLKQEQMIVADIVGINIFACCIRLKKLKTLSCFFYDFMDDIPPSTAMICPVIQEASSDNKKEAI